MRTRKTAALIALVLAVVGFSLSAHAEATVCTGDLTGTFDSIIVPAGQACSISNATIEHGIVVFEASELVLSGGVTVNGNISASGSKDVQIVVVTAAGSNRVLGNITVVRTDYVKICGTEIGGNVHITDTRNSGLAPFSLIGFGGVEPGAVCQQEGGGNTVLSGNVRIEDNDLAFFRVADNVVSGNMTIEGNTGTTTKRVLNNQVGNQLTCRDNVEPFEAAGNTARKLVGQCEP